MSQLFASGGQRIRASALALPVTIQGWFHLGLTGLISLQFKGLSGVLHCLPVCIFLNELCGRKAKAVHHSRLWLSAQGEYDQLCSFLRLKGCEGFSSPLDTSLSLSRAQSLNCVWLFYDPMDGSPLGYSVHGISQASILEWVAVSSSMGYSWPRDLHVCSLHCRQVLYYWANGEAPCPSLFTCKSHQHRGISFCLHPCWSV